ncbi:MAG: recombinase RecT [Bacteroidales bacterium]|nr:recombinase RecT [Bacteroidales bacterium]
MANNLTNASVPAQSEQGLATLKRMLDADSVQKQFQNALGEHKNAFVASIIDLYTSDAQLQACNPRQVIAEALKAATLNLPINRALGFSYIVVYKNNIKQPDGTWAKVPTPTFVIGYKGLIQLALRTGMYRHINADVVYEGELRETDKLTGAIDLRGKKVSDKVEGYFAHFELIGGFAKTLYMSVNDMARYAKKYSPSVGKDTSVAELEKPAQSQTVGKKVGWEGNFGDMALKTVLRRLLGKYGFLSVEMCNLMAEEQERQESLRDSMLATAANGQAIVLDSVEFTPVDEQTGRPISPAAPADEAAPTPETEEEPY